MSLKKHQIITCSIQKLAFGGLGIAEYEGLKIFIPESVPGDEVSIRITKKKNNFAEGKIVEILKPSAKRIAAKCPHFGTCGGCTWQFLSYEDQLFYKQHIVTESLEHLGGIKDFPISPIIGCPEPWYYRNKMEFSFAIDANKHNLLGLHPKGYHYDVIDLQTCFLPHPSYALLVKAILAWVQENNISIYEPRSDQGLLTNVVIRHNQKEEFMIHIISRKGTLTNIDSLREKTTDIATIKSALHTQTISEKGKPTTRTSTHLWGDAFIAEELALEEPWQSLHFDIYPEAFFQPNPRQAVLLYQNALRFANITNQDIVLDLYCGTGTLGLFASRQAKQVIGIDNVPDAIKSAQENATKNNCLNTQFHVGDAGQVLNQLKLTPTIAIVDPPRAGLLPDAIAEIITMPLKKLVYISCNPTTQARDVKLLVAAGYDIEHIQPVDMFPHTYHIENIVVLTKQG
jgi:23S rRNA (uracil1939-C5)-methyltransferase